MNTRSEKVFLSFEGIGKDNNYEYILRLAQQRATGNYDVKVGTPAVTTAPKPAESPQIDISAVNEVAQKYSGSVPSATVSGVPVPAEQPKAIPVSKEFALNLHSKPKYNATEAYNKSLVASQYHSTVNKKVIDAESAPKPDSYSDLLYGADYVGLGFNGADNINNKKLYFAA